MSPTVTLLFVPQSYSDPQSNESSYHWPATVGRVCLTTFPVQISGSRAFARFRLPAMDLLYERIAGLPDGPERLALMRQAERLAIAYMPYKFTSQEVETHLTQARLVGFRQPAFRTDWFHQVDIDDGPVLAGERLP